MNSSQKFALRQRRREQRLQHKYAVAFRIWNGEIQIIRTYATISIARAKLRRFHEIYWNVILMHRTTGTIIEERSRFPAFPYFEPSEKVDWLREGF